MATIPQKQWFSRIQNHFIQEQITMKPLECFRYHAILLSQTVETIITFPLNDKNQSIEAQQKPN